MHEAPTQQTHAAAAAAASERASKLWRRGWEINLLEMKFSLALPPSLYLSLVWQVGTDATFCRSR